jgi:rhodanese-related sulfurtransferase
MIVDVKQPIVLITEDGKTDETITRLSRVGFDRILGHLKGGYAAWVEAGKETDVVHRITADEFANEFRLGKSKVIDIRKESEYAAEHLESATCRPLSNINDWIKDLHPEEHVYIHCAGGYRSMIAASILQSRGYRNFTEIEGGFASIAKTLLPKSDFVCQSNVLK